MIVSLASIQCSNINSWDSLHDEFSRVFGFPDSYGRNMDAWIDCLSSLSSPEDGMTDIHCEEGKMMTIELVGAKELKSRCPEQYEAILECSAFVNWRLVEVGQQPLVALSFNA